MKRWDDFKVVNRFRATNRWLQVLLILSLIGGVNFLGMQVYQRWDLTQNHRYSLSPETRAYLRDLSEPVEIIVTIRADSRRGEEKILFDYLENLLREYVYFTSREESAAVSVEFVDIYQDLERAEMLAREYGLEQPNTVIVRNGERRRFLRPDDLIEFEEMKPVRFRGEAALTSAILEITQNRAPVIYSLVGHGETGFNDPDPSRGLSRLGNELRLRNFVLRTLDLSQEEAVPEDAELVLLADPKGALLPTELDKLRTYLLDRAGRMIIFLGPGSRPGLDPLLREWGLQLNGGVVFEKDPASVDSGGSILLRNFGEHPVTESLIQNQTWLASGLLRPVLPSGQASSDDRLVLQPLAATSKKSWVETNPLTGNTPSFDPDADIPGPIPVAMLAERRAHDRLGINLPGGRLLVIGSGDLFANRRLASLGNVNFFFQSLNWLLDRDQWVGIPPRPVPQYQIALSQGQFRLVAITFLFFPVSILLLGFGIFLTRRIH